MFVQVSSRLLSKLAVFITAFFVSFYSFSSIFNNGTVPVSAPQSVQGWSGQCETYGGKITITANGEYTRMGALDLCSTESLDLVKEWAQGWYTCNDGSPAKNVQTSAPAGNGGVTITYDCSPHGYDGNVASAPASVSFVVEQLNKNCPNPNNPNDTYSVQENGETVGCADPNTIPLYDSCDMNQVIPAGSNTSQNMCMSMPDGSSCSIQKGSNGTYFPSEGNCYLEPQDEYQPQTPVPQNDNCTDFGGSVGCKVEPNTVCSSGPTIDGATAYTCQAGCGLVNGDFLCFNGAGQVDELPPDDFVASQPDSNGDGVIDIKDNVDVNIKSQTLANETNRQLMSVNNRLDALVANTGVMSTLGQQLGQINQSVKSLGSAIDKQTPEEKTFSANYTSPDNTALSELFNQASIDAINVEIENKKLEIEAFKNTVQSELDGLVNISVSSSGYDARPLNLTFGSFDLSLSRLSQYFSQLSAAVMFLATIIAFVILLGSKE